MKVAELSISGAWEFVPQQFPDDRGNFLVWYDETAFAEALGFRLHAAQSNHSVSRRDVVRGVHWADVPPGQGKYVYCPRGALLDIVVDLRVGSPTFGQHEMVRLDTVEHRALYLAEGLGHAFLALTDDTVLTYLCSTGYNPGREHILDATDPGLGLPLPTDRPLIRSARDTDAPTLAELLAAGRLPSYEECQRHYRTLRSHFRIHP